MYVVVDREKNPKTGIPKSRVPDLVVVISKSSEGVRSRVRGSAAAVIEDQ